MWEGFFADAYATGEAAYATVKGMQDAGTLTVAKHYIGYEQETSRYDYATTPFPYTPACKLMAHRNPYSISGNAQLPISSNIDNKALHEVRLHLFCGRHSLIILLAVYVGIRRGGSGRHIIRYVVGA